MTGQIGYYGIRSIVTIAPSACGSVYFTAAILMLYFYYSEDRVSNLCIAVIMFILAILTISKDMHIRAMHVHSGSCRNELCRGSD